MNKSSDHAIQGNKTSNGSIGITRYAIHKVAMTLTQRGLRLNCSTYWRVPSLNLCRKESLRFFQLPRC